MPPDNEETQQIIEKEIDSIYKIIRDAIPACLGLKSIIWHGGFAIGEGGMYRFKDRWLPYGDYDITIVSQKPIPRIFRDEIYRKIVFTTGYRSVVDLDTRPLNEDIDTFKIVDLKFIPYYSFVYKVADISTYDLKQCSKILYGDDLRDRLKVNIADIPLVSPLRIIFNRLFTALDVFSIDFMKRKLNFMEMVALKLALTRIWLSLGMALTFYFGEYRVSYIDRIKVLRKNENRIGIETVDNIEKALLFKIYPDFHNINSEDVIKEWFLVMEVADSILRLLFGRYIDIGHEDRWYDISHKILDIFLPQYYTEYLKTQFSKTLMSRLNNSWTEDIISKTVSLWENIKFMGVRHWTGRWQSLSISPEGRYFAIIPLLVFSLGGDGKVEKDYLPLVRDILYPLSPHELKDNGPLTWEKERKLFCSAIRKYKYTKNSSRNIGNIIDKVKFWR